MKKTKWYGPDTVPGQNGVYECHSGKPDDTYFYYWNGYFWEYGGQISPKRVRRTSEGSLLQSKHWRGLTKEVKA